MLYSAHGTRAEVNAHRDSFTFGAWSPISFLREFKPCGREKSKNQSAVLETSNFLPPLCIVFPPSHHSGSIVGGTTVFNRYTSSFDISTQSYANWQKEQFGSATDWGLLLCKLASIHITATEAVQRSGCSGEKSMPIGVSENFGKASVWMVKNSLSMAIGLQWIALEFEVHGVMLQ